MLCYDVVDLMLMEGGCCLLAFDSFHCRCYFVLFKFKERSHCIYLDRCQSGELLTLSRWWFLCRRRIYLIYYLLIFRFTQHINRDNMLYYIATSSPQWYNNTPQSRSIYMVLYPQDDSHRSHGWVLKSWLWLSNVYLERMTNNSYDGLTWRWCFFCSDMVSHHNSPD